MSQCEPISYEEQKCSRWTKTFQCTFKEHGGATGKEDQSKPHLFLFYSLDCGLSK